MEWLSSALFAYAMLCLMPEVESTLIWNNSAWNPPQYFVENNWDVCLLSCISQSGSPFTLTLILTTPNWNCLAQLLINTISPCIELCTFIANQKASICWRHSIGNKSRLTGGHFACACVNPLNDNNVGASNLMAGNRKLARKVTILLKAISFVLWIPYFLTKKYSPWQKSDVFYAGFYL